jgi:hypothetical protein
MGTSSDDLIFDKTGKNQNSLHFKYNKFLVSPYLERKYNNYNKIPIFENQKNEEKNNNNNYDYESFGETNIFYPKPNYYNNIYTQKFSKKYKKFYINNNISQSNLANNNIINNYINPNMNINSRNNRFIRNQDFNINKIKTPDYQIRKEIEMQKTPDKYNNYKRYDDYYFKTANKENEKYSPSILKNMARNNLMNPNYSSPYIQRQTKNYYL